MADIAGSTAIGEALGPERSKYLFDEVMRLVAAEVERYDGTVAQLAGDGLLAVFGAPVAHEDDSERAVRAGLAIQRALERYGVDVREAYDIDIRARVAVNTGPVVVAPGDGDARDRYNALGDTVNVTARLQAHRRRGRGPARPADGRPGALVVRARGARARRRCVAGPSRSTATACCARSSRGRPPRRARSSGATASSPRCATRSTASPTGSARSSRSRARPGSASRAWSPRPRRRSASGCSCWRAAGSPTPRRSRTARCASSCATGSAPAPRPARRACGST